MKSYVIKLKNGKEVACNEYIAMPDRILVCDPLWYYNRYGTDLVKDVPTYELSKIASITPFNR